MGPSSAILWMIFLGPILHSSLDIFLRKKQREIKYAKDLKSSSTKAKIVKIADILANVNDAPNAGRNAHWEKQQFVKKSKYWSYVSSVKPGKLAEFSWANNEWKRLQEKYS